MHDFLTFANRVAGDCSMRLTSAGVKGSLLTF
jgi:hypothetical protein